MSNIMLSFNDSFWQDNGDRISNKIYYNNENLNAFINYYFIPWLNEVAKIQNSDDPVRVRVRHFRD